MIILKFIVLTLAIACTFRLIGLNHYKKDIGSIDIFAPSVFISAFIILQFII